ncbi:MAG TPA: alpha/beta fold hydrolase [Rugosimonospora sp.]|nr:alpha/beta fold hydrolase [Rugosimonospora sp.]
MHTTSKVFRGRRRVLAAALAVGAAAAALAVIGPASLAIAGTSPDAQALAGGVPSIDWHPCPRGSALQCGTLLAPRDYAHPDAGTVSIAVRRLPATDRRHVIGPLVVNPGGPGSSGIDQLSLFTGAPAFAAVAQRFDVVTFDPRGVGASTPGLKCEPDAAFVARIAGATVRQPLGTGIATALADGRRYAQGCAALSGPLLPDSGTGYAALDLERLRVALGAPQISYFGLSYGTILGNVYADMYPGRVRAAVLDGAVDPHAWRDDPLALFGGALSATQHAVDQFLAWCAATPDCPFGGGHPAEALSDLLRRIDGPARPGHDGTPAVNAATVQLVVVSSMGDGDAGWPQLAQFLATVAADPAAVPLSGVITPDVPAALHAAIPILCTDFTGTIDRAHAVAFAAWSAQAAPMVAPVSTLGPLAVVGKGGADCASWPVRQAPSRYTGGYHASGVAPILVVGTTGDPNAPYPGAVAQAATIDNARLLTFHGTGHIAFLHSTCTANREATYLLDGTLPPPGTVCDDDPGPGTAR